MVCVICELCICNPQAGAQGLLSCSLLSGLLLVAIWDQQRIILSLSAARVGEVGPFPVKRWVGLS